MMNKNQPIGVFDSGIGGLTVLKHLRKMMPNERFLYLGDTARVPYGNKSKETIRLYAQQCAGFLMAKNVKLIVVACNTVSANALDEVQDFSSVPVVGMIAPAARGALQESSNGRIGIIGTRATIGSNAYQDALRIFHTMVPTPHSQLHVTAQSCPLFVPLAEEGWQHHQAAALIAQEYLKPMIHDKVDTLIMGCTHYPLLHNLLSTTLPNVTLIDCGEYAAKISLEILTQSNNVTTTILPAHIEHTEYFITDTTPNFSVIAEEFLGYHVPQPQRVIIEPNDALPISTDIHSSEFRYG